MVQVYNLYIVFFFDQGDTNKLERHKEFIDTMLKGARYFIIKSNNHENVTLSKAKVSPISMIILTLDIYWVNRYGSISLEMYHLVSQDKSCFYSKF